VERRPLAPSRTFRVAVAARPRRVPVRQRRYRARRSGPWARAQSC